MKQNANKTVNMNANNYTKVICQNCGAEVLIPRHEETVTGTIIGQDSNLGTIVMPTCPGGRCQSSSTHNSNNAEITLEFLKSVAAENPAMQELIDSVSQTIFEGGYMNVKNIVRRWIPSQCLRMLSKDFHKSLLHKGYEYSWKVLLNDLKRQFKLYRDGDKAGVADRQRWYNRDLAVVMARDYINQLICKIYSSDTRRCKGRGYYRIFCKYFNYGKGIFCDEVDDFYGMFDASFEHIVSAKNPKDLYLAVQSFVELIKSVSWLPEHMCEAFVNAYKAAGCYYTMKDLILFEGCVIRLDKNNTTDHPWYHKESEIHFVDTEASLKALDEKVEKMDVMNYGYMMLGLLKDFIKYNNFDYQKTLQNWSIQSQMRRDKRRAMKCNRRSR